MKISKYLKFVFFVYLLSLLTVVCQSAPPSLSMDTIPGPIYVSRDQLAKIDWSSVTVSNVRYMEIYNACSQQLMQITSRRSINSYGQRNSSYVRLRVEALKLGSQLLGIRISSSLYNTYLCFSKRGKLTAKYKGSSLNCLFREKDSWDDYTQYQSLWNRAWFIGFNRKGKPLAGIEKVNTRRPRCFKFMKFHEKPINPISNTGEFTPFDIDNLEKVLVQRFKNSRQHTKRLKAKNKRRQHKKLRHRKRKRFHRRRHRKPSR